MGSGFSLNKFLYIIIILIIAIILTGTVVAFISGKSRIGSGVRVAEPAPQTTDSSEEEQNVFTALGQIRTTTPFSAGSDKKVTVILEPWFSYQSTDPAFKEELISKRQKIKSIFINYFTGRSYEQLRKDGEALIKQDLTKQINNELVLGTIEKLYFEEYLFLE